MLAVGAVVAAGGAGLTACGGGSGDLGAVFTKAYAGTIDAKSASVTFTEMEKSASQAALGASVTGTGAFDWGTHQGRLSISETLANQTQSIDEILDGTDVYVKVPAGNKEANGKPYVKVSVAGLIGSSGGSGDPTQALSLLEARASKVTRVGTQTISGTPTTQYHATVDPTQLAAAAPPAARQALQAVGVGAVPIDVFVDSSGRAKRIAEAVTLTKAPAAASSAALPATAFPLTVNVTMTFGDYGTPVAVSVPPPDQVTAVNVPALSG